MNVRLLEQFAPDGFAAAAFKEHIVHGYQAHILSPNNSVAQNALPHPNPLPKERETLSSTPDPHGSVTRPSAASELPLSSRERARVRASPPPTAYGLDIFERIVISLRIVNCEAIMRAKVPMSVLPSRRLRRRLPRKKLNDLFFGVGTCTCFTLIQRYSV